MNQSHGLLFGSASPVPETELTPEIIAKRAETQDAFISLLRAQGGKYATLLAARFNARQVSGELSKMFPGMPGEPAVVFDNQDFTILDHVERLRYLEVIPEEEEVNSFRSVLESVLPGLEQFITDERYATLKGQMLYNSYGVYYGEGRDDKVNFASSFRLGVADPVIQPDDALRPEDKERTRSAVGTARQIGSAFYFVSSYVRASPSNLSLLSLIVRHSANTTATRPPASCSPTPLPYVSLPRVTSRQVTRSPSPTSTPPRSRMRRKLMPAAAVGWNLLADGASLAAAHVAWQMLRRTERRRRSQTRVRLSLLSTARKRRTRRPSRLPLTTRCLLRHCIFTYTIISFAHFKPHRLMLSSALLADV